MVRSSILSIWNVLDPIYYRFTRLHYIEKDAIFRVRLVKYRGRDIILSDGSKICKDDCLVKIHLHNIRLLREKGGSDNHFQKGKSLIKMVLDSMPILAEYIQTHAEESRIKGVIGLTMINKGYKAIGFDRFLIENKVYKRFKKVSQLPIYLLSSSTISLNQIHKMKPAYLIMSKERLFSQYRMTNI